MSRPTEPWDRASATGTDAAAAERRMAIWSIELVLMSSTGARPVPPFEISVPVGRPPSLRTSGVQMRIAPKRLGEQVLFQGAEAGQVVGGGEDTHVGKRGLHTAGEGLVPGAAQQWVQPDQPAGPRRKRLERGGELERIAGVPAVAQDDHDGAAIDELAPLGNEG